MVTLVKDLLGIGRPRLSPEVKEAVGQLQAVTAEVQSLNRELREESERESLSDAIRRDARRGEEGLGWKRNG